MLMEKPEVSCSFQYISKIDKKANPRQVNKNVDIYKQANNPNLVTFLLIFSAMLGSLGSFKLPTEKLRPEESFFKAARTS